MNIEGIFMQNFNVELERNGSIRERVYLFIFKMSLVFIQRKSKVCIKFSTARVAINFPLFFKQGKHEIMEK